MGSLAPLKYTELKDETLYSQLYVPVACTCGLMMPFLLMECLQRLPKAKATMCSNSQFHGPGYVGAGGHLTCVGTSCPERCARNLVGALVPWNWRAATGPECTAKPDETETEETEEEEEEEEEIIDLTQQETEERLFPSPSPKRLKSGFWSPILRPCPPARTGFSGFWPEIGKNRKNIGFGLPRKIGKN